MTFTHTQSVLNDLQNCSKCKVPNFIDICSTVNDSALSYPTWDFKLVHYVPLVVPKVWFRTSSISISITGNLLKMQILRLHRRHGESETKDVGGCPETCLVTSFPVDFKVF